MRRRRSEGSAGGADTEAKGVILITDANFGEPDLEEGLVSAAGYRLEVADCRSEEDVIAAVTGAEPVGLLVQYAPITHRVLDTAPSIRAIARYGSGVDTIDLDAAAERFVEVLNVPEYGTAEVADHALALLLTVVLGLPEWTAQTRSGRWPPPSMLSPAPELASLTLGLFGYGRIGRAVAARAHVLGMHVLAHDPFVDQGVFEATGVSSVEQDRLWSESNVVSLHAPLTGGTEAAMDRTAFGRLPAGSFVVNTARGGLIDRAALEDALADGRVERVGLDVWWEEPPREDDVLLRHPRVVVTPHVAWWSQGSVRRLRTAAARQVVEAAERAAPTGLAAVAPSRAGGTRKKEGRRKA